MNQAFIALMVFAMICWAISGFCKSLVDIDKNQATAAGKAFHYNSHVIRVRGLGAGVVDLIPCPDGRCFVVEE